MESNLCLNTDAESYKREIRARLARRDRIILDNRDLICAAVLLPLLCKDGAWHILVTQRTQTVEHHKGQISFPGGACEAIDKDSQATALRETYEEVGVPPECVEVLGVLDDFCTITGFLVTPFVGVIPHPFEYSTNSDEVESAIEVPLSFFCDGAHLRVEEREFDGRAYEVLFWDYGSYTIWGATAQILKTFLDAAECL